MLGVSYPLPYAPDPHCGTRLKPDFQGWWRKEGNAFIHINKYGFRHGDRNLEKPENGLRIAVLGDSFIEAFQVPEEQTFCAVLEKELTDCESLAGRRVEVLNFGVSGYGTAQELQMLRHYVWQYEPDMVVLAFFAGNDVRNNLAELEPYHVRPFFQPVDGNLVLDDSFLQHPDYLKAQSPLVRCKVALTNRIRLLQLINHMRAEWRQPATGETDGELVRAGVDLAPLAEPKDNTWKEAWEITERLILEVAAEAERHQAEFCLLTIGNDVVVHPDEEVASECCRELGVEDLFYSQRRLTGLGAERSFAVINLAHPMQHYARQDNVFLHGFKNSELGFGHWNVEGNCLAAELVATKICGRLTVAAGQKD